MHFFNRITTTIGSKIEKVVSHIEDHDAVVELALRNTRASLAAARVRLARVQKDGTQLRERLHHLEQMEATWTERARNVAAQDEAKALACVARRNQSREQAAQVRVSLAQHNELATKIGASVARMEQRLAELTQQRNLMRSRHSAADALRVLNRIEGDAASNGLDDAFERWEMQIMEAEYASGMAPAVDALDTEFTASENADSLKAELDALLNTPAAKE